MHIDGFNATSFAVKAFAYLAKGNAKRCDVEEK